MTTALHGIFTPLITPLNDDESPDLVSLARLVEYQIGQGVHGLWAMGTTAEFASFDADEREAAVRTVVDAARGRVPIIANVSDAATRLAIRHARRIEDAGVAGIAATPPYYYPHSQDEVLEHYRALRAAVDLPLFIYNIPQTVRVRVELSTAETLATEGTAAGIKDSQNDLEWFRQLTLFVRQRDLPFAPFAGTRYLIDAAILAGAVGAIPSVANAFPDLCVGTYQAAVEGDVRRSMFLEQRIIDIESLTRRISAGSRNAANIGLQKAVLQQRGVIAQATLTGPLRTLATSEQASLAELLAGFAAN